MEQLFNPQLPEGERPELQLCIFPHLREFLVFDSRGTSPEVLMLNADDIFDDDFYHAVESEFSEALRATSEYPFSHLINLPIHIEETVRDIAMTFILDRLGVQVDDEDDIPPVVVYVVSGGALASQAERVQEGLKQLLNNQSDPIAVAEWETRITELVEQETAILEKLNRQQVADALKGDIPDYFTLWESRN